MKLEKWLDIAEISDALRLFPRFFCATYLGVLIYVTVWYCHLLTASVDQTAFTGTVYAAAGVILKFYMDGGRDWSQRHAKSNPVS